MNELIAESTDSFIAFKRLAGAQKAEKHRQRIRHLKKKKKKNSIRACVVTDAHYNGVSNIKADDHSNSRNLKVGDTTRDNTLQASNESNLRLTLSSVVSHQQSSVVKTVGNKLLKQVYNLGNTSMGIPVSSIIPNTLVKTNVETQKSAQLYVSVNASVGTPPKSSSVPPTLKKTNIKAQQSPQLHDSGNTLAGIPNSSSVPHTLKKTNVVAQKNAQLHDSGNALVGIHKSLSVPHALKNTNGNTQKNIEGGGSTKFPIDLSSEKCSSTMENKILQKVVEKANISLHKRKEKSDAQMLQRKRIKLVEVNMNDEDVVRQLLVEMVDRVVIFTSPKDRTIGTQHTLSEAYRNKKDGIRSSVATSLSHCVDVVVHRVEWDWAKDKNFDTSLIGNDFPKYQPYSAMASAATSAAAQVADNNWNRFSKYSFNKGLSKTNNCRSVIPVAVSTTKTPASVPTTKMTVSVATNKIPVSASMKMMPGGMTTKMIYGNTPTKMIPTSMPTGMMPFSMPPAMMPGSMCTKMAISTSMPMEMKNDWNKFYNSLNISKSNNYIPANMLNSKQEDWNKFYNSLNASKQNCYIPKKTPEEWNKSYNSLRVSKSNNYIPFSVPTKTHEDWNRFSNSQNIVNPNSFTAVSHISQSKPFYLKNSESKYSFSKLAARTNTDGSVMPASTPKMSKDGLYMRPVGRNRKGMNWDNIAGKWVRAGTTISSG